MKNLATISPIIVALGLLLITGCKPDGRDLDKTIAYYYNEKWPSSSAAYSFLSKDAKDETSEEEFGQVFTQDPKRAWEGLKKRSGGGVVSFDDFMKYWNTSNFSIIRGAKVVHQETIDGKDFVAVQNEISTIDGKSKKIITDTWVKEGVYWRRHRVMKHDNQAEQLFQEGRYNEALDRAILALQQDPLSISAYYTIVLSIARGGDTQQDNLRRVLAASGSDSVEVIRGDNIRTSGLVNKHLITEIIRRMLSINTNDTIANQAALAFASDPILAKPFLVRLRETAGYETALSNFCMKLKNEETLTLLAEEGEIHRGLLPIKLTAFARLERWEDCRNLLNSPNVKTELLDFIADQDPKNSGFATYRIGMAALASGDTSFCQQVVEKGAVVAPGQPPLEALVKVMKQSDPVSMARKGFVELAKQEKAQ